MRFILRSLLFAAAFLAGSEALRRWLEGEDSRPSSPSASPTPPSPTVTPPATSPPAASASELESMSRAELYERAQDLGLEGRSKMNKAALIDALRASGETP